ncbi:MAG: HDIG domain-containing protein [Epulopiscium sp.]|nr:HDIG domain-containing protein [Candidatus Epulonipiscium sp.]
MRNLKARSGSDDMLRQTGFYQRYYNKIILVVAFLITVFCAVTGSYAKMQDDIQVGSVAPQRYVALKDAVDTVATEKLKKEAMESVGPLYTHDEQAQEDSIEEIQAYFNELDNILSELAEGEVFYDKVKTTAFGLPVVLNARQCKAYESLDAQSRKAFRQDCIQIANYVYEQGVTDESITKAKELAENRFFQMSWNNDLNNLGFAVFKSALKPNMLLDQEATQDAREKKAAEISNVMIKKNQKIVDEGEIITEELYQKLDALNLIEHEDYGENIVPILGGVAVIGLIFLAVGIFFATMENRCPPKKNEVSMLFTIYSLLVILMRIMGGIQSYTIVPFSLFAMLVSLLIGLRVSLLLNGFMSIVACFIFRADAEFVVYILLTGSFAALVIRYMQQRKNVIPVALAMGVVHFLSVVAVGLYFGNGYSHAILKEGAYGAVAGMISVIITLGSLPFWETAFEANTPFRLLELTNPNNALLRRLMIEAPGTYHHSLIVGNLAETAAYEIGANAMLARVGATYHDIGKLTYPLYFSENQGGENPHDSLEPFSSAQIIIQHSQDGTQIGQEQGLPKAVINIIREHHGTSLVKYFYVKAVTLYGQENVKEQEYRYPGPIPQSRESAVVMLADTVEAAVRSVLGSGEDLEAAEKLIRTLIKDKLDDGQLNESGLGIHDLETIRNAFLKVFHGMYHSRVAYPNLEDTKN